jgi:hypothetical protein
MGEALKGRNISTMGEALKGRHISTMGEALKGRHISAMGEAHRKGVIYHRWINPIAPIAPIAHRPIAHRPIAHRPIAHRPIAPTPHRAHAASPPRRIARIPHSKKISGFAGITLFIACSFKNTASGSSLAALAFFPPHAPAHK